MNPQSPSSAVPGLPDSLLALRDAARTERAPVPGGHMTWRIWGAGPPVILLHGAFGSWTHWVRNIPALARRHTVIVPDLPGAGDSALGDVQSMEEVSALVARGLDHLGVSGGYDLVAFSYGTSVGLHLPAVHRARVRRLVLVGSAAIGPFVPVRTLRKWRQVADPAERVPIHAANLRAMMVAHDASVDPDAVAIHMHNVEAWRLKLRQISPTGVSAARLAEWRPACLDMIWGGEDVIVNTKFEALTDIVRAVAPATRTHFVADAGHWVQYEGAEGFNRIMADL